MKKKGGGACVFYFKRMMMMKHKIHCNFRAKESHQIAQATVEKNARIKEAFGIGENYVDGSSFDPNRKAKEEQAKAVAMAKKKYALVLFTYLLYSGANLFL